MKKLEFFGYNDDLVHYKIDDKEEEIDGDYVVFGILSKEGMFKVIVRYEDSIWSAYPVMWEEGEVFPDWTLSCDTKHSYSVGLSFYAPDDVKVAVLSKDVL